MARANRFITKQVQSALDMLKYEIANEFGIILGADTTSRENGSVGGEMTKRLIQYAESQILRL